MTISLSNLSMPPYLGEEEAFPGNCSFGANESWAFYMGILFGKGL